MNNLEYIMRNMENINVRKNGTIYLIKNTIIVISISIISFFLSKYFLNISDLYIIIGLILIDFIIFKILFDKSQKIVINEKKKYENLNSNISICPQCGNQIISCKGLYICEKCNDCIPYHKLNKIKRGNYILKNRK
jgi:hypothetical protein